MRQQDAVHHRLHLLLRLRAGADQQVVVAEEGVGEAVDDALGDGQRSGAAAQAALGQV